MKHFIGTSSYLAEHLIRFGWDTPLAYSDLAAAREKATEHSLAIGGHPVIMEVEETALLCDTLMPEHIIVREVDCRPLVARLEMETAGIGDILTSILTKLKPIHHHIINAIKVGKGEHDAGVSNLFNREKKEKKSKYDLGDEALEKEEHRQGQEHRWNKIMKNKYGGKIPSHIKNPFSASNAPKPGLIGQQMQKIHHSVNRIRSNLNILHRHVTAAPKPKKPIIHKPKAPPKPRAPRVGVAPKAVTSPKAPRVGRAPRAAATPKLAPGIIQKGSPWKTAPKTVTLQGHLNGQPASTKLKKGDQYTVIQGGGKHMLLRQGGTSLFHVHPSHVGLL
jgi:hypothetical protein